jgi:hypothetical protein
MHDIFEKLYSERKMYGKIFPYIIFTIIMYDIIMRGGFMRLSDHAKRRYSERYMVTPRFDPQILETRGFTKDDFGKKSSLRRYLITIESKNPGSECIIYRGKVFIVKDSLVLTTYPLRHKYLEIFKWADWRYENGKL